MAKIRLPDLKLADGTLICGPFTKKPDGKFIEFIIKEKSYWISSTKKDLSAEENNQIEKWIKKKFSLLD